VDRPITSAAKPYGVDLIVPNKVLGKGESHFTRDPAVVHFRTNTRIRRPRSSAHGIDASDLGRDPGVYVGFSENLQEKGAFANAGRWPSHTRSKSLSPTALAVPPAIMLELARNTGSPSAALVGAKELPIRQVQPGVDILVAAGGEAGGQLRRLSTIGAGAGGSMSPSNRMGDTPDPCRRRESSPSTDGCLMAMGGGPAPGPAPSWLTTHERRPIRS